nr:15044_t:CDS:2 [Entrophospora candida]
MDLNKRCNFYRISITTTSSSSSSGNDKENQVIDYEKIISGVNKIQRNSEAAYEDMLWWGIIELRINGVSPNPTI